MNKLFLVLVFAFILNAKIIDGIALKVDGNIITLYEIDSVSKNLKKDKQEAINTLITDRLRENEIKRLKIKVTEKDINEELENIALNNKITINTLRQTIESRGIKFEDYKKQLKEHMLNRYLLQKILQTSSSIASDDELKKYYDNNKLKFSFPSTIKATSYASSSDVELQRILNNPLLISKQVIMKDEVIDTESLPSQILSVFVSTPVGSFTPVLNSGNTLIVFYIKDKIGSKLLPFEDVKDNVIQHYAEDKEKDILGDYFSKKKATAKIEYIRNN